MKILITGPQGSGKTTQSEIISKKLELCLANMGELLRQRAKQDDEIGKKMAQDINRGILADNNISSKILRDKLSDPRCQNSYIVDGYPRDLNQIELFDPNYDVVIYLVISVETSIDRLLKRGRADDTPEGIKQRLELFENETQKTIEYYQKQGKVIRINGEQPIEQVTEEILSSLKEHDHTAN